jgi:hypothetical protein
MPRNYKTPLGRKTRLKHHPETLEKALKDISDRMTLRAVAEKVSSMIRRTLNE